MNANCTYCNSKRHPTERCMMHKPKGFWTKTHDNGIIAITDMVMIYPKEDIHTLKYGKPINPPTITIKELSYLLSKVRKDIKRSAWGESSNIVAEGVFRIIRKQLNLRKRARV